MDFTEWLVSPAGQEVWKIVAFSEQYSSEELGLALEKIFAAGYDYAKSQKSIYGEL